MKTVLPLVLVLLITGCSSQKKYTYYFKRHQYSQRPSHARSIDIARKRTFRVFGIVVSAVAIVLAFIAWQASLALAFVGVILSASGSDKAKPNKILVGVLLSVFAILLVIFVRGVTEEANGFTIGPIF